MTIAIFPSGANWPTNTISYPVIKQPNWKTRKQRAVSGRTLYTRDMENPIWNWTLTWELLRDNYDRRVVPTNFAGQFDDLRHLMSFYNATNAGFLPFLFWDMQDYFAGNPFAAAGAEDTTQILGTGDGTTTFYPLVRQLNNPVPPRPGPLGGSQGWPEPVHAAIYGNDATLISYMNLSSANFNVYVDGTLTTAYDPISHSEFSLANAIYGIKFHSPPPSGKIVTASFYFFFLARFAEDTNIFENFYWNFWTIKQLKIESCLMDQPIPS